MILFAFSNGMATTLMAIKAPSKAREEMNEQVASFVGVFIVVGMLVGSIIAIGMQYAVP